MYSIRRLCRIALPSSCPLCGLRSRGGDLCPGCLLDVVPAQPGVGRCPFCALATTIAQTTPAVPGQACDACASPGFRLPGYARAIAAIDYDYPGAMLIGALKERGRLEVAGLLGRLVADAAQAPGVCLPGLAAIVPVPASGTSLRRRGFNPAGEIARAVSAGLKVPLHRRWLARVGESTAQKALGRVARQQAPQGSYRAMQPVPDAWIGLVDDVMTTGSTLHHAATALLEAGARGVVALVAARTPAPLWHNDVHVRRDPGSA